MDIVEYAEKIYGVKLYEWQKELLTKMYREWVESYVVEGSKKED